MPKSARKRSKGRERKASERVDRLLTYLASYAAPPAAQSLTEASTDNQLKSILSVLASKMSETSAGTVLDIGSGDGILLKRLVDLEHFRAKTDWLYVAVDRQERVDATLVVAVEHRVHRRVDGASLDDFYKRSLESFAWARPIIVVCRNVLHELELEATAVLLHKLSVELLPGEVVLFQDLQVFPQAEKGNACWIPSDLAGVLQQLGFSCSIVEEPSRSGNRWFNIIANRGPASVSEYLTTAACIRGAREHQWQVWSGMGALHPDDAKFRDVEVAKLDFDLQFAALTAQLNRAEPSTKHVLTPSQQSVVVHDSFRRAVIGFALPVRRDDVLVSAIRHFKDRANSQDALKAFLEGDRTLTIVTGPALMGKTELVRYVLSTFQHDRVIVALDAQVTTSVWNLLEMFFSALGCHIPAETLLRLRNIRYADTAKVVEEFARQHARRLVVVVDHTERLLDPAGQFSDDDIERLLHSLASAVGAKVILTSRRPVALRDDLRPLLDDLPHPPVGRFPDGPPHVENVLGTFVGRTQFPKELLSAIDRHPLLAVLAGMYLHQAGFERWSDEGFLSDLKGNLRNSLFARVVDERSRPAVELMSRLRVAAPRALIAAIAGSASLQAAEDAGLVYEYWDPTRTDLVSCVGALRLRTLVDSADDVLDSELPEFELLDETSERDAHGRIANEYEKLYRSEYDARWLRELHYHRALSGGREALSEFGSNYRSEIYAAGEYWFIRRKDFSSALWAFRIALALGERNYHIRMRVAACLMRTGAVSEGEQLFRELITTYPSAEGVRGSYIDSLLYLHKHDDALARLKEFGYSVTESVWIAGQYGRAFSGLHMHREAIEAFNYQMQMAPDAVVFLNLARAHHRLGATSRERRILEDGTRRFPYSKKLQLAYSALLERVGEVNEAVVRLLDMHSRSPRDGWIVFPLIKALCRRGDLEQAKRIWREVQYRLDPDRLRYPIAAELALREGRFEEALAAIRQAPEQDEHSVGQKLEIYYAWASTTGDGSATQIAQDGLAEPISPVLSLNVPVLLSRAKLALVAGEPQVLEGILGQLTALNPELPEISRFRVAASLGSGAPA